MPADGSRSRVAPEDGGDKAEDTDIGPENAPKALRRRHCTDFCCLILFVAFALGMAYLTYLSCTVGDPYSIMFGADYLGNRCGRGRMSHLPKTFYPRMDQDALEQADVAAVQPWKVVFYGLCVASCPSVRDPTVCFGDASRCMVHDYGTVEQYTEAGGSAFYFAVLPTISVMNRCIPTSGTAASRDPDKCVYPPCNNVTNPWMVCDERFPSLWLINSVADQFRCEVKYQHVEVDQLAPMRPSPLTDKLSSYMGAGQRLVDAILDARDVIIGYGLGLPIFLGLAWLLLLRFLAGVVVYLAIVCIGIALFALAFYLFAISGELAAVLDQLGSQLGGINSTLGSRCVNASSGDVRGDFGSGDVNGSGFPSDECATANALASAFAATAEQANQAAGALVRLVPTEVNELSNAAASENPMLYTISAWVALTVAVLYMVAMCLARKKIRIAVALIKEACGVLADQPAAMALPLAVLGAQLPLLIYLVVGLLFLGTAHLELAHFTSSSALTAHSTYSQALVINEDLPVTIDLGSYLSVQNGAYVYFLFGILWTMETVRNIGWTTLSGAFSDWYFFRRDAKLRSRAPLVQSLTRVVRYHLGTILFGSFLIALVQLVRILLELVDRQTKKLQETNAALKLAIKCVKCCLYCFEKSLKFITNYCYIYVALQGSSFCSACIKTFGLITSQPAQLALNTFVRVVLGLIQTAGITVFCTWICHAHLERLGNPEPMYPALITALAAYVIASSFALVFSCALDTLFVCAVRDKVEYKGAFMSDGLYSAFGFDKAERKADRSERKARRAERHQAKRAAAQSES